MKLERLFNYYQPQKIYGAADIELSGLATHTKEVNKNCMFFALAGEKMDGHDFITQAVNSGASIIVSEKNIGPVTGALTVVVDDIRTAQSIWSAAFYGFPASKLDITGVTGTNGKTTITNIIYQFISMQKKAGLIGTSGYFYGEKKGSFGMTTPHAHMLHYIFSKMYEDGVRNIVMEVSSHALKLKRVNDIRFSAGLFTNLTQDHLDFHKDFEDYYLSKYRLFELLKEPARNPAVINIDDPYGKRLARSLEKGRCVTYGIKDKAAYNAIIVDVNLEGSIFILKTDAFELEFKVNLVGEFNIYNCLAAIAWALESGFSEDEVKNMIKNVYPVPGRLEIINSAEKDITAVIDYAHSPAALENVLKTLKKITKGKLICVFGCGGDRDRKKRPLMAKAAANLADKVFITSDNPRTEDPDLIIEDIKKGVKDTETDYAIIPDREEAIKESIETAGQNDCILIAGKGDEDYQIIGTNKIYFSDRDVAKKYLKVETVL